jgi:hypothetical protein
MPDEQEGNAVKLVRVHQKNLRQLLRHILLVTSSFIIILF